MKLPTQNDSDRGQVGIGTLIIFIALVLVAAVAAGVLVTTAGDLQSRASDTGADAQAQVSNQIDVVSATGAVNDSANASGESIDDITLVVKKSAGSDPIDLSQATIEYTSNGASETLSFDNSSASSSAFTTAGIDGADSTILENTGERVEITIDAASVESGSGLAQGGDAELRIVDQSGATTIYGVNVPDVLTGDYAEV